MNRVLELMIVPNSGKKKEFSQTLNNLAKTLQYSCSSLKVDESADSLIINITVEWGSMDQMRQMLQSEDFNILSGAITALCEKVVIRLNGKIAHNHISSLNSLLSEEFLE